MEIKDILANFGIESLNKMQEAAMVSIKKEDNIFLLAPTGSGKTLGFLLPIFGQIDTSLNQVQVLIISPTRELALQIESVWKKMGTGIKVNTCYGGHDMAIEVRNLSNAPAVLIGTPGRLAEHIDKRNFSTEYIKTLVLDEFDKSLAMGFEEEMGYIVRQLKNLEKQVMVSATTKVKMPAFMGTLQPKVLNFTVEKTGEEGTLQMKTVFSESKDKINSLYDLICEIGNESSLIFVNHRDAAERTSQMLNEMGIETAFFHGGMEQPDRERTLINFRNSSVQFLVASDLAARGLDIPEVRHVIHYHLPLKKEDFQHRNGRTARQNASGTAYIVLYKNEPVPTYITQLPESLSLKLGKKAPQPSEWTTIYISGGKKEKLNKIDIVGFLSKKGGLEKGDLGMIEVKDFMSFAAIKKEKVVKMLSLIKDEKMKGKKYKIEVAK
jgi:superfamily II DNA/RNA helicase